jgi:hypothetical protein
MNGALQQALGKLQETIIFVIPISIGTGIENVFLFLHPVIKKLFFV